MPVHDEAPAHDAVILAGGRATRLGGAVKPLVDIAGRTLLARALEATSAARRTVVVGDLPVPEGVLRTVEDPPFSGPAAGLAAGLSALATAPVGSTDADDGGPDPTSMPWTLVLAADVPRAAAAVPMLLAEAAREPDADGVCFHDRHGHPQWMLALYRTPPLTAAVSSVRTTDLSLRRLLAPLHLTSIAGAWSDIADCDTWADVEAARERELSPGATLTTPRSGGGRT